MPSVRWNRAEFKAILQADLGRDLPFATVRALTWTAKDVQKEAKANWIPRTFDRPTRYTLNSVRVKPATKVLPVAEVLFKDTSAASIDGDGHYLVPQVRGGARVHTRFEERLVRFGLMRSGEWAMPAGGLKLDRYGNVPAGIHARIIAQLGIGDAGYNFRESARTKAAKARRGEGRFFVADGTRNLPRGIWERHGREVKPLFVFAQRRPNYRAIFKWKDWAEAFVRIRLPDNFYRSAADIMRRRNA